MTHRKHRPLVGQPQTPLRIRLTFCANQLRGNPLSGVDADVDVAVRGLRDPAGQREQAAADARERAEGRGQHDHRDQSLRHGARRRGDRLHPRLAHRGAWADHQGPAPILPGTVIGLEVDHLPGDRQPTPLWLLAGGRRRATGCRSAVAHVPAAFRYRADLPAVQADPGPDGPDDPHPTGRRPLDRDDRGRLPQLRLARHLAEDLRRPWEWSAAPGRLTPARVRRGPPAIPVLRRRYRGG